MDRNSPTLTYSDGSDVLRWVDRMLIRLCARYADYRVPHTHSYTFANLAIER
jgi:hypothetical protein